MIHDRNSRRDGDRPVRPCLFFDQFEELFTADPIDLKQKAEFLEILGNALADRTRWAVSRCERISSPSSIHSLNQSQHVSPLDIGSICWRKSRRGPPPSSQRLTTASALMTTSVT